MTDIGAFLSLRYDLRAPAFGAPPEALYQAALEQCAWAEENGFLMATLSEHHGSEDGYCPSPVVMAAAIAGRTRNLRIMIAAPVLPLYDPIRAAEDLAVLDLASGGRVPTSSSAPATGARSWRCSAAPSTSASPARGGIEVLRQAWTGEEFEASRRRARVTPRPARPEGPGLILGVPRRRPPGGPPAWGSGSCPSTPRSGGTTRRPAPSSAAEVGPHPGSTGPASSTSPTTPTRHGRASRPTPSTTRTSTAPGWPAPTSA